ncbi:MAG: lipase family alpha/beta hydrolase [Maricaulaceae bacterium]
MTQKALFSEAELSKAPSPLWSWTEPRVIFELAAFYATRRKLKKKIKGDGHPVMVVPGFLGGDGSTATMRNLLTDVGYNAKGWGLGQNKIFNQDRVTELTLELKALHKSTGRKVSLVGWSLGGVFVREVARRHPDLVRQVVTLGSPISGNFNHTFAYKVYKYLNGEPNQADLDFYGNVNIAPPVPTTSIYSKSDGIVAWRNSIQPTGPMTENVRVKASHSGMGSNPHVMLALTDRLSQPEGQWQPYQQ